MSAKQYMTIDNLTLYDTLIKTKMATDISEAEARSLHTVILDGTTLKFYREEEPVGSATPAYSISLPQQDLSNYLQKITGATGGYVAQTVSVGTISESSVAIADIVVDSDLADVATSGDAEDVAYDNTTSGLTATDVQAAIDELAGGGGGSTASKTVYITETAGTSSDAYAKRYGFYQGSEGSPSSPVPAEKLIDLDIPKDMFADEGVVVDVVFVAADDSLHEGSASGPDVTAEIKGTATATSADAGKYIKITLANTSSTHLWIKATDLVDVYTVQPNATQIQLAIDANNVISATVVAGSIGSTELASSAVTTVKIADDAVTASKIDISAHTESQDRSAAGQNDGLSISVTTTDGQVSAVSGSIRANTYDAYGAASAVVGQSGDAASANTVYGAKAYADAATEAIAEADIRALFATT